MLTQSYAPIVGGEERVVEDLSGALVERGHHVAVATLRQGVAGPDAHRSGVAVHTLRSSVNRGSGANPDTERLHAPPGPDPVTAIDLGRVLRRERPDVVHAHNWLVHSYLPLHRRSGAALVLSLHDYGFNCATKRLLYHGAPCSGPEPLKCLRHAAEHYGRARGPVISVATRVGERRLRRMVDVFLPISTTVRDLSRLGSGDAHRVVPNFIGPLPPAPDDQAQLDRLPREPYVLFFGDVSPDKGADVLLEAYRGLEDPPPLVLLGRWALKGSPDRASASVLGPWPRPLVIEAVRRALFTVAPSVWPEPFGLVALETAAVGRPIVASAIGGLEDIVVDGETGLLVPSADPAALRAGVEKLLADPRLRTMMGAAAERRAAEFGTDAVLPRFEEAYELALAKRGVS